MKLHRFYFLLSWFCLSIYCFSSFATFHSLGIFNYLNGRKIVFLPDNQFVVVSISDEKELLKSKINKSRIFECAVSSIASTPEKKDPVIAVGLECGGVYILDQNLEELAKFDVHAEPAGINALAFSSDGKLLASGGNDGKILIWDVDTIQILHCFNGHDGAVQAVSFMPHSQYLVSGGDDGAIRIWDALSGTLSLETKTPDARIRCLAVAAKDKIVSIDEEGNVILWSVDPNLQKTIGKLEDGAKSIQFNPESDRILIHDKKGKVLIFSIPSGKELIRFQSKDGSIAAAFLPSKRQLVMTIVDEEYTWALWEEDISREARDPQVVRLTTDYQ